MASWVDSPEFDFEFADEEREQAPMSDAEHLRNFGWAWDDPSRMEPA